jgi:hypothetical protein
VLVGSASSSTGTSSIPLMSHSCARAHYLRAQHGTAACPSPHCMLEVQMWYEHAHENRQVTRRRGMQVLRLTLLLCQLVNLNDV